MENCEGNKLATDTGTEMDDSGRSQELLESVEMVTQMRTDVVKLSATAGTEKGNEEGEPPPELISAQYINIHRVPETLSKELVECESPAPQSLISGELMQHHVVHGGMVVDMMVPPPPPPPPDFSQQTPLDRTTLPQYIPEHYDAEDDLLTQDLTEEDRRLAAALVAVQLVQQQKQQHHHSVVTSESNVIVSPGGLPSLITTTGHLGTKVQVPVSIGDHHITTMTPMSPVSGVAVDKPGMAAMVTSYIQAVEETVAAAAEQQLIDAHQGDRIMKMYHTQPQHQEVRLPPLPPLKKVLSSQSMAIRHRYIRPHLQDLSRQEVIQQQTDHLGGRLPQSQQDHQHQAVLIEHTTRTVAGDSNMKVEYDVKSEGLEDDLGDESDEPLQDDNDSDYDIESDLRSSRKSLPHKKRIPRKLKNPKKSASPSRNIHAKCYKCIKCGEQFGTQSAYASHRLTHNVSKKMFSCELCGKGFPNQLKFFEHLKSHYEPTLPTGPVEPPLTKPTNNKEKAASMKEESEVKEERENKQPTIVSGVGALPPPLTCNQCGKTFRRQKAFETHVNLAHPKQEEIEEFSEPEDLMEGIRGVVDVGSVDTGDEADMDCLPSPSIVRSLKNNNVKDWYREEDLHAAEVDLQEMEAQHHQQQQLHHHHHHLHHIEDPDNICELCGDIYENKELLEQHVRADHLEFTPDPGGRDDLLLSPKRRLSGKRARRGGLHLTCPQCGRMFNHRNSLVYHLRSHSGERPHQCEVCGKSFFAASALKVHMRLHSGDKPYKCEFCGRHFRQWGDLKYHCISIHSEEKNYQCEYCGKDFARKYSLIVHRRIHTGEKNYKCEFCGKSFRASSYLQNHRRIHTGEKPHPCGVCGKPFRVRSDMKRHLNTHNRDRHHRGTSGSSVTTSGAAAEIHQTLLRGPKLEEQDSELDPDQLDTPGNLTTGHTITVEHQNISDLSAVTEITIQPDGPGPESILPDESLADQQPINLNIAVPTITTRQSSTHPLTATAQTVTEEVLHYTRDPLETVRDGNNTFYVWPIYMT